VVVGTGLEAAPDDLGARAAAGEVAGRGRVVGEGEALETGTRSGAYASCS
jgi:hypothetical protein